MSGLDHINANFSYFVISMYEWMLRLNQYRPHKLTIHLLGSIGILIVYIVKYIDSMEDTIAM